MPLPALGVAFTSAIAFAIPFLVARVLIAMGITIAVYGGVGLILSSVETSAYAAINGLPADALAMFRYAGGFMALQIWFGALALVVTIKAGKGLFKWNLVPNT
jgi:hypothetical protein